MKKLYFMSAYDRDSGEQIESIPVEKNVFQAASKAFKWQEQDCYDVTSEVAEFLRARFSFALNKNMDYQLEVCGDYTADFR